MKKGNESKGSDIRNGSGLRLEAQLWAAADKMRGGMHASEYKHICLEPYKGRVFDPCFCSRRMFMQSGEFVQKHGGRVGDIAVYRQKSNSTPWKLARVNLPIRGIDANLGQRNADSYSDEPHNTTGRFEFVITLNSFSV